MGKALIGWILICLVITFASGLADGLGVFLVGLGGFLICVAFSDWISSIDMSNKNE